MPENNNSALVEHQNRSLLIQTIWKSCSIVEAEYKRKSQSQKALHNQTVASIQQEAGTD
jgi:hypothetical protein